MNVSLEKAVELVLDKLGEHKIYGQEAVSRCPFCGSDKHKFYLNVDNGLYNCKRASCMAKGNINNLLAHLGLEERVHYDGFEDKKEPVTPLQVDMDKYVELDENSEMAKYLISRGISLETLNTYGVMRDINDSKLVFITTKDGKVVNASYRTKDKLIYMEKGSKQALWGREFLDYSKDTIILTEGRIDSLTLMEMGIENVVSMPNGASSHDWITLEWDLLNKFEKIVLCYDNDEAGKRGLEVAKSRLDFATLYEIDLKKYKDINEAYMDDSGFMYQCIRQLKQIEMDGFISLENVSTSDGVNTELYSCGMSQFDRILGGIRLGENTIVVSPSGVGKAQPMDSSLFTSNGVIKMRDVKIGDRIYGEDGQLHNVIGVFPQGVKQKVRITFSDKTYIDCCDEHLWNVITNSGTTYTKSVKEIIESGILSESFDKKAERKMYASRYRIPITEPVSFPEKQHIISPYLLGILIGDGYMCGSTTVFSTSEQYIVDRVKEEIACFEGYTVKKQKGENYSYLIVGVDIKNYVTREIRRLGLNVHSYDKFIPHEYMFDSVENRLAILRGIFDTDGYTHKARASINTTSRQLKDDIVWLCQSLGMLALVTEDTRDKYTNGNYCYKITIQFKRGYEPFTSPKHKSKYTQPIRKTEPRKFIRNISYLDEYVEMQCIQIDNPTQLYLTDNFTVTHNTTVLCNMLKGILSSDEKCAVYSGELTNASLKAWIYSVIGGKNAIAYHDHPFRQGEFITSIKPDFEKEIDRKVRGRLFVYDGGKSDGYLMLKNFSNLNKRFGVKFFFIDNLSILSTAVKGMGQYEGEEHFARALAEFCRTHKAHVFLFAHPTKQSINSDPEFLNQKTGKVKPIQRYDQYNIRGSASFANLAHNIMFLMRAKDHERAYFIQKLQEAYEEAGKLKEFEGLKRMLREEFSLFAYLVKNRGAGKTNEDTLFGYDSDTRRIYGLMSKEEDLTEEVEVSVDEAVWEV